MADTGGFAVIGPERATLRLPDGVTLVADIYRPEAPGRFPALVMRQPYGRRIASTIVLAHPSWYAAQGYVVIVQDVRGRGDSEGAFRLLEDDAADGAATLAWAADHAACNGQVATYGFSYQAMTQLLAFAGATKAGTKLPDAMAPAMGAWSVRDDWVRDGGCFRLAAGLSWAIQMAVEQARLAGDEQAFGALMAASTARVEPRPAILPLLDRYAPHYRLWLEDDASHFAAVSPETALEGVQLAVPSIFVGGWFDGMLAGTLAMHRAFSTAALRPQRLIVGPWQHIPWSRKSGMVDLGPAACSSVDQETVAFFDHHLKQRGEPGPPVRLFDLGLREWITLDAFPKATPLELHLASRGLAATTSTDGKLMSGPADNQADRLVFDPWRPTPLIGGHVGQPPGLQDRSALDDRTDVAVYTSDPLPETVRLLGVVVCELLVESDMPSHDLHCSLSMLDPDGRHALTLATGHLRVADSRTPGVRCVSLSAIFATIARGSRLRLYVQAAAWPAFAVNPGTGTAAEEAGMMSAKVITLAIHHNGSRMILPVAS
jgi:putative CocE/NonD family hydrolase